MMDYVVYDDDEITAVDGCGVESLGLARLENV
jgi:hypothetical protein